LAVSRAALAAEIVRASHALHTRGWVANHDGNVSVRLPEGRFLVTPTAVSKAAVAEGSLACCDASGKPVEGESRPPSEFSLHSACFGVRPDIGAVVHAHPPHATAIACAARPLDVFLPEAVVSLGPRIPVSEFALPFGEEGAAPVRKLVDRYDAILLCRHGVLTLGADVEQALLRMELVEHLARILLLSQALGGVHPLPAAVLRPLVERRRKAGLGLAAERTPMPEDDAGDGHLPPSMTDESAASRPAPGPPPGAIWRPAGPPPAPDAWSGGALEATCAPVYGAGPLPALSSPVSAAELARAVRAELARHTSTKS
jgi:L-fuculose-phosphate aldolase